MYGEVHEEGEGDEDNEGEEAVYDTTLHANVRNQEKFCVISPFCVE